jgi:hypothetical protein
MKKTVSIVVKSMAVYALALLVTSTIATAQVIVVPNFSFESDVTADQSTTPLTSGWTSTSGVSVYNPQNAQFSGTTFVNVGTPGNFTAPADGLNDISFTRFSVGTDGILSASSLVTTTLGGTYDATVAVARRADYFQAGIYTISLVDFTSPSTIFASSTIHSNALAAGGVFQDLTVSFTDSIGGRQLAILIQNTADLGGTTQGHIDNVRLFATVPEPATYVLLALGLGVLLIARKRQVTKI